MITFNEYIDKRRIFIGAMIEADEELQKFVRTNNMQNNFDHSGEYVDKVEFHTTLWYSKTGFIENKNSYMEKLVVPTKGWKILGKDAKHLTVELEKTAELSNLRDSFKLFGMSTDWPTWVPHVTLVYYWEKGIPNIKPPKFMTFDRLQINNTVEARALHKI